MGGTLQATTDAQGRATFTNVTVTGAGTYTLSFAAVGFTAITSDPIVVTGAPVGLAVITSPTTGTSGQVLVPSPVIGLWDSAANFVPQAGITIGVAKSSRQGALSGTLSATTDAQGRATFSDLILTGAGHYTLV